MRKYICDRCGKEVKGSNIITLMPMSEKLCSYDVDLCFECGAKFSDFVNELGRCKIDILKEVIITEEEDDGE